MAKAAGLILRDCLRQLAGVSQEMHHILRGQNKKWHRTHNYSRDFTRKIGHFDRIDFGPNDRLLAEDAFDSELRNETVAHYTQLQAGK